MSEPFSLWGGSKRKGSTLQEFIESGLDGAWVFPARRTLSDTVTRIDSYNWLNRTLKSVSMKRGTRVNHQISRRVFATLAYNSGGDLKDIQAQIRHASVNNTANKRLHKVGSEERTQRCRGTRPANSAWRAEEENIANFLSQRNRRVEFLA